MQRIFKEIPLDCEIALIGDTHIGSYKSHESGVDAAIDFIAADEDRYWAHLGDWIEAITTDDKRYECETTKQPIPLLQAKEVVDKFKRIAHKGLVGLLGNHERKLHRFGNLVKHTICQDLKIPYGTFECRLILAPPERNPLKLFLTHGTKVFKSNAKTQFQRDANQQAALKLYLEDKMGDCNLMACVSEDTEILTDNGWRNIDTITYDDKAITFNIDTEAVEKKEISNIIINEPREDLYCFKSSVTDLAVTGTHDMLIKTHYNINIPDHTLQRKYNLPKGVYCKAGKFRSEITRNGKKVYRGKLHGTIDAALDDYNNNVNRFPIEKPKWVKKHAQDIADLSQITIPTAAQSGNSDYNVSDNMLWLIGLLIAEGSFRPNKTITISQRESNITKIRNVLNSLGLEYSEYYRKVSGRKFICPHSGNNYETRENIVVFYIHQDSCKRILDLISIKNTPQWTQYVSDRQFDILLDGMMFGDGTWATIGHSGTYWTSDKSLADRLQIACVTHGWKSSIVQREKDMGFAIYIHKQKTHTLMLKQNPHIIECIKSDKRTWCISNSNGTIFVRRNGKVSIIGNCGHAHWLTVVKPDNTLYLTDGEDGVKQHRLDKFPKGIGYIHPDSRWYCCSGSFYKLYVDGMSGYNEQYSPSDLGFLNVIIEGGQIVDVEKIIV